MASAFTHTLHALKQENTFWNKSSLLFIAILFLLWGGWIFFANITLYKTSSSARLESHFGRISIDSPVSAQIFQNHITLGQEVKKGDVLVELNSHDLQLELAEIQAKFHQINAQIPVLENSLKAEQNALHSAQSAFEKMHKSTQVRRHIASEQIDFAKNKFDLLKKLRSKGYAADLEYFGAGNDLKQAEAELQVQNIVDSQIEAERIREQSSREAKIARLRQEYTQLTKQKLVIEASSKRLQYTIEQHQIKATVSGRISDVPNLRSGTMIKKGQRFATIITDNPLHIVSEFPIDKALGRLQKGQAAKVRLQAFPWIQYGMLQATVREVDNESQSSKIRVELDIKQIPDTIIPQHGLTGQVEIAVEKITPAALLLRVVGQHLVGENKFKDVVL